MKTLDRKASEILRGLLALQKSKIDNSDGTYMPIHIEIIDRTENYTHISLAHYGRQNGDVMRDPEMIIALHKESQQFVPYYYRNDLWVWSSTALDGQTRAFCRTVVYRQTTPHSLTNGYAT